MKRYFKLLSLILAVGMITFGCRPEGDVSPNGANAPSLTAMSVPQYCGNPTVTTFYAGQHINVGDITVGNDDTNLYVTFSTTGGWSMQQTHLYVGDCNQIPTNGAGNPQIGHFPLATRHNPRVTMFTYTIPLSGLDSCFCVAAHAEVVDGNGNVETAWGDGDRFVQRGSWATYFQVCQQPCSPHDPDCEILEGDFRTQTQGGWGSTPRGGNPGAYLAANFAGAFPNGLEVGCNYTLSFSSASAIQNFLPQGGTAAALTQSYSDPTQQINVLAGQVVALAISLGMDAYDPNFGASPIRLADLVVGSGPFAGWTVGSVFNEAEKALGGCASAYSLSDLNDAVSQINENFVDGTMVGNYLTCPDAPGNSRSGGRSAVIN